MSGPLTNDRQSKRKRERKSRRGEVKGGMTIEEEWKEREEEEERGKRRRSEDGVRGGGGRGREGEEGERGKEEG